LKFGRGIVIPRDFSGDGQFVITADQLVLRNIWLGTRQAPRYLRIDVHAVKLKRKAATH